MAFVKGFCDIMFIVVPDDRLSLDSLKGLRGIHSQAYSSFILVFPLLPATRCLIWIDAVV